MTILGVGKMSAKYASIPDELRAHMGSCLLRSLPDMHEQGASTVIYAFGLMGCQWPTVCPTLQDAFQQVALIRLRRMSLQGIFMTLYGFANMEVKWANLLPQMRKEAEQAMIAKLQPNQLQGYDSAQHVTNSIHSLGKMAARWESFSPAFRSAVLDAFILLQGTVIPQSMSNFIYG